MKMMHPAPLLSSSQPSTTTNIHTNINTTSDDEQSVSNILLSLKRQDSPVLGPTASLATVGTASSSSTTTTMPRPVSSISLDGHNTSAIVGEKRSSPSPASSCNSEIAQQQQQPNDQEHARKKRKLAIMNALKARGVTKKFVIRPSDYARTMFKSNGYPTLVQTIEHDLQSVGAFQPPTQDMINGYTPQILNLVRRNDLDGLRSAMAASSSTTKSDKSSSTSSSLNCCNSFGESLLHGACRRGQTSIVKYLVDEVGVDVCAVRDDYQRTVLHDAFWTAQPNKELVETLLRQAPELLLLQDVRGFTPLDYVPTQDWGTWLKFLWERKTMLRPKRVTMTTSLPKETTNVAA